jgi:DNA-binding response OmpR family regulator
MPQSSLRMPAFVVSVRPETNRILLVDAAGADRERYTALLQRSGFRVDSATDAETGWETLRENGYDLLVVDHRLPGRSGLRLVAQLRNARITLPVILLVGPTPPEELHWHAQLPLAATLGRPFTAEQLLELAVAVLQRPDRPAASGQPLGLLTCGP